MNKRKIICLILTVVMVVAVTSSAAFADGEEGNPRFTFDNGISLEIPSELGPIIWTGMAEDDPCLDDLGIIKSIFTR